MCWYVRPLVYGLSVRSVSCRIGSHVRRPHIWSCRIGSHVCHVRRPHMVVSIGPCRDHVHTRVMSVIYAWSCRVMSVMSYVVHAVMSYVVHVAYALGRVGSSYRTWFMSTPWSVVLVGRVGSCSYVVHVAYALGRVGSCPSCRTWFMSHTRLVV